jgi:hypothetical protein
MIAVRHRRLFGPLLLASLFVGCDRADPLQPPIQAASTAGSGSTPVAPSGSAAVAVSHSRIDVSWQDNSTSETGFEVHRSSSGPAGTFTLHASPGAGVTGHSDLELNASTQYCYKIRALKATGRKTSYSPFSETACATTLVPPLPAAPSGTNATLSSGGTVNIVWIDNSSTESGFRVERSLDDGGTWMTARTTSANVTSSNDYGRTSEQLVCYRVIAFNSEGDSPPSNTDCTTPPAGPTGLTASVIDPQTIDLSWTDNSAVEEGFEVQRTDGVVPYTTIADLSANSVTYRDVGVTSDITYRYIVRAKKDGGFSEASNVASATVATAPPNAPSETNATPYGSSGIGVGWTDNSLNEDGFRVQRSTDGGMTWATVTRASNDFFDSPLPSEQEVCYRIVAFNDRGDSPPSNIDCTRPPAGPTNLTVSSGAETMDLAWTDNSAVEDGYEVVIVTTCTEQPEYWLGSLPPNSTSFQHYGWQEWWLTVGCNAVGYYVVAMKDGGYSDSSNQAP